MREMSASEAARNFSAVLSATEHGETIVVTRSGRQVAYITPAPRASGKALREIFAIYHKHPIVDDDLAMRVEGALSMIKTDMDADPWKD